MADLSGRAADSLSQLGRQVIFEVFVKRHAAQCSTKLNLLQQHKANRAEHLSLLTSAVMATRTETRQKLRRENLVQIKKERFKKNIEMADKLGDGFSPSYLSQLLSGHRGIGDDVADKIEERLGLESGYLDTPNATSEWNNVLWLWNHQDAEIRVMFSLLAGAMYRKKSLQIRNETDGVGEKVTEGQEEIGRTQ
jgi:transcriptional regulator with XRE-family HTH domain